MPDATPSIRWAALRIAPSLPTAQAEFIATAELVSKGYEAYCPKGAKWVQWEHGRRAKHRIRREFPIFSRYLFVGLSPGQVARKNMVHHVEGVLGDSLGPIFIPASVIDAIRKIEQSGAWDTARGWRGNPALQVNYGAKIIAGPFVDFIGTVTALTSEQRIKMLITLFGRPTEITIDSCYAEPMAV